MKNYTEIFSEKLLEIDLKKQIELAIAALCTDVKFFSRFGSRVVGK